MIATTKERRQRTRQPPTARYGSAATCAAAGIDAKTLNNWLGREPAVVLLSDEDRRDVGTGERKRFSFDFRRVMQIALTAELVNLGVQPRRAAIAAATFTDMAEGAGAHPGHGARKPGELFEGAYTFLVVPPNDAPAKVLPVTVETAAILLLDPEYGASFSSAIIVRVDSIFHRVSRVLLAASQER